MTMLCQVVVPFHQPLHATSAELDEVIETRYQPLLDAIAARSDARLALHFDGRLLDHLARYHRQVLDQTKTLNEAGQIEILGGLFYGGKPALLPELDVRGQIEMSAEFWESTIGVRPVGFWLPELAWCAELPRLLSDTGLEYGFVSDAQLATADHQGLGLLSRADQRMPVFILDSAASQALPAPEPDDWVAGLKQSEGVVSVWVRASALSPGGMAEGWLNDWLDALGREELPLVLPSLALAAVRPASRLVLRPEVGSAEFTSYAVDTLYRRMLQQSEKLRECIATMEEDELEEKWSDALATAQRLVFAAQAPEPHGDTPDPAIRRAVSAKLIEAANLIDALTQEDDWIAAEELDHDGDLIDEVHVATAVVQAPPGIREALG